MPNPPSPADPPVPLVERARAGDRVALDELIGRVKPKLEAAADRLLKGELGTRIRRSDLIQSALMQIFRGVDNFRGITEPEFAAWALRVLRNESLQSRRFFSRTKRTGEPSPPPEVATPSRVLSNKEDHALLMKAMQSLDEDQRQALHLKIVEDLPHAEIAARLGKSEGAVRMLVARACRNLALQIDKLENR
jgi:RNA polymerase sigma-70 factor (ECF subfamily)